MGAAVVEVIGNRTSSAAQREQQANRSSNGRYAKGPKCECCRKPAGHNYSSHSRCSELGFGLVLCEPCCFVAEDCTTVEQFKALSKERRRG